VRGDPRLPVWLTKPLSIPAKAGFVRETLSQHGLNTVCDEARCPNRRECFGNGTATLLILGGRCTRDCRFCAVDHGAPQPPDGREPSGVAAAVGALSLRYVVVTSVTRDDLPDGGAAQFAGTITAIRETCRETSVEVLVPDFGGDPIALGVVVATRPDVLGHNIETVERLYRDVRDGADYRRSLELLEHVARAGTPALEVARAGTPALEVARAGTPALEPDAGGAATQASAAGGKAGSRRHPYVKSALMLGLGERSDEVETTLTDLRGAGVEIICLGQYLRPSETHHPVARFVHPDEFREWAGLCERMGFSWVSSAPFVRSSYRAHEAFEHVSGRS
jgi:lipoic acid synthetase